MKMIDLTRGQVAIVSDEDYEALMQWSWCAQWNKCTRSFYAIRGASVNGKSITILMSRQVLGLSYGDNRHADHRNHNTLDNRRSNLRSCTRAENKRNGRLYRNNVAGFKGVNWRRDNNKFRARIRVNGKLIQLGQFNTAAEAADAYDRAALEYHKEFAMTNKPAAA